MKKLSAYVLSQTLLWLFFDLIKGQSIRSQITLRNSHENFADNSFK